LKKSLDVLILFILVIARVRLDTLADLALPQRHEDVRQLVGGWWPTWSLDLLAHPETDPVSMMLIVTAFGLLVLYLIADFFGDEQHTQTIHRLKLILIYGIIALLVFGKTILLINLRHLRGPVSYAHDGGVIQTEVTIDYFLWGLNPYAENYVDTPMAEWGYEEYRTALYHYPYLLTQKLVQRPQEKRMAVALMGLNPILAVSLIFGENDPFVLAWIVVGLWLMQAGQAKPSTFRLLLGSAAFGLACASKLTAWFLTPFWLLYLLRDQWGDKLISPLTTWRSHLITLLRRVWTLPVVFLLIVGPWFVGNPKAMYDDVWRWSTGQGSTGYQIWGWGASNYVLGLGWVADRFEYWPFIIPELIITLPLLGFLLWRQARSNTMGTMLYGYVVLLLAFSYVSRFLQPNYLGYMLGFLTLAILIENN
jgi:hypothetical protein